MVVIGLGKNILLKSVLGHCVNTITFSNGASAAAASTGGQGPTCMFTTDEDSNDYVIVSFHFIIQIFYDCIFTKKPVAKCKNI